MKRRTFLQNFGAATALLAGGDALTSAAAAESPEEGLLHLFVKQNDNRIAEILDSQETAVDSPWLGGFANEYGIYHVGRPAWHACHLLAGAVSPQSAYYQSDQVEECANLAIEFVRRRQHDDGTIDLVTTNFHSPPDTAFAVEPVALALGSIRRHAPDRFTHFQKTGEDFLSRAGKALSQGGIHTPNHRWVVCMALARIHHLLPHPNLVHRVDQWLAEGIDIDSDGQYTERSTAVYTPLVDRCLITVARLLDRAELFEPVRRNLALTCYLVRPNGELVTEVSHRQDQFGRHLANRYYYPYRYLAARDQNASFSAMVRLIEKTVGRENLAHQLVYALEDPDALAAIPPAAPLNDDYEKYFPNSKIVRIRRGNTDASIIAENSTVFTFHKGAAVMQSLRLATAFFGKGQFVAPEVRLENGEYVLTQRLTAPYVQPLPAELLSSENDWSGMPHARRELSEVQQLTATIAFRESAGRFQIRFDIQGTEHVPLAIELAFRPGGDLQGVRPIAGEPDAFQPDDTDGSYQVGDDIISFGRGPTAHRWTQLRGAEPKLNATCVYFTGYTPFEFEMTVS